MPRTEGSIRRLGIISIFEQQTCLPTLTPSKCKFKSVTIKAAYDNVGAGTKIKELKRLDEGGGTFLLKYQGI